VSNPSQSIRRATIALEVPKKIAAADAAAERPSGRSRRDSTHDFEPFSRASRATPDDRVYSAGAASAGSGAASMRRSRSCISATSSDRGRGVLPSCTMRPASQSYRLNMSASHTWK
jgi:hypothetical protein